MRRSAVRKGVRTRTVAWPIAQVAAVAVALWVAPVASAVDACAVREHARAAAVPGRYGMAPLVIGDSTMLLAAPILGRLGLEVDARGCRQFGQGLRIVARRQRAGALPRVVVLALGANGPIAARQLAAARRLVGRDHTLVLVTPRRSPDRVTAMRRAARRHPDRVLVADWVRFSARHRAWFADDGLHVGPAGARAYAAFLRGAVAPLAFPPVAPLRLPRRVREAQACGTVRRDGARLRVYVVRGADRVRCERARQLARAPRLRRVPGWTTFDWRATHHGPWAWVHVRADRRAIVATVPR